ncbi:hypothetical protein F4781DRAFT_66662 [Annulohypoxylon bovei var. microspora]|nr:hypothetical protein F4781DRAFT_66662 [Annulohypoxylon bovei var. microspora]
MFSPNFSFDSTAEDKQPPRPLGGMGTMNDQLYSDPWNYDTVPQPTQVHFTEKGFEYDGAKEISENSLLAIERLSDNGSNETQCSRRSSGQLSTADAECANLQKRLACPYFKHNPKEFRQSRPCYGPGFGGIYRLKEHLYRKHGCPRHPCHRCHRDFKTEAGLSEHVRSQPCVVKPERKFDGQMTAVQEEVLRSKKRRLKNATDDDKWNDIYGILFPDTCPANTPSPYFEDEVEPSVSLQNPARLSQGAYETILKATPSLALKGRVMSELCSVFYSPDDDHIKVNNIYKIVCKFPEKLLKQEQSASVEGV